MKFQPQTIHEVFIIEPEPFTDERGVFRRHFCDREFAAHGIATAVRQCNVSENKFRGTLRGFHYQLPPFAEGKTLSCLKGAIHDVVVDLRADSPTYLKWISAELNDQNRRSIHIPPGCANAFLTLEDDSLIQYYCSNVYDAKSERGIRFDDPTFAFQWPERPALISDKDRKHPDYLAATRRSEFKNS